MRLVRSFSTGMVWVATVFGAAGWFLMSGAMLGRAVPPVTVGIAAAGAALVSLLLQRPRRLPWQAARTAGLGGVLAFWAAPYIVLSQRASDAPSGTETLIFSVVAFGLAAVAVAAISGADRPSPGAIAAAVVAAAGAAALVSNWERPSSFSPFIRWPGREAMMLVAALLFAAGSLLIVLAERRHGRGARTIAVLLAGVVAVLAAAPSAFTGGVQMLRVPDSFLVAASFAMFANGWLGGVARLGLSRAASTLLAVPAALTTLIIAEKIAGVRGTDPIVWAAALPAIAVSLSGIAALLGSEGPGTISTQSDRSLSGRILLGLGAVAAVIAAVTLAIPAISQSVEGAVGTEDVFRAQWTLMGYQSGAGWAVFAAGLCALASAWELARRAPVRVLVLLALAAVSCGAAFPFLGDSTFGTWNSWVPGDIQHAYGTEYAHLTVEAVSHPLRVLSAVLSVSLAAVCAALAVTLRDKHGPALKERS